MHHSINDIAGQAHQGSIAAIIQTLNEKLAAAGIRTRAILADGVLQLLCEAAKAEQLEQSVVVAQLKQILEEISPRNIHRVKINSRIVREQQLLWLEEINRDPENQLLWSQEFTLAKPNLFQRLAQTFQPQPTVSPKKLTLPKMSSRELTSRKHQYWRGIISGISVSLVLMGIGWWLYDRLSSTKVQIPNSPPSSAQQSLLATSASTTSEAIDPFVEAVRIAQQAASEGQTVQTSAQWLDLAAKWQRASDLMAVVEPEDPRYEMAQTRVKLYRQNSEVAQEEARKVR